MSSTHSSVIHKQSINFYISNQLDSSSQNFIKTMITHLLNMNKASQQTGNELIDSQFIVIGEIVEETDSQTIKNTTSNAIPIVSMVDGRGLSCPMPLLKTKVALREVAVGEALYVLATDPNSGTDIAAFCQQTQQYSQSNNMPALQLLAHWQSDQFYDDMANPSSDNLPKNHQMAIDKVTVTLFHFIIAKTDNH